MWQFIIVLIPVLIIVGIVALTARQFRAEMRKPTPRTGPWTGFRRGLATVPVYFVAVGAGHCALAVVWTNNTAGVPKDGQAFSGTFLLGLGFILLGLFAAPYAIPAERDLGGIVRGGLGAVGVAAAVVAYTASRGYDTGGVAGELRCIVEQGRQICPPGDGTYIRDARPDVFVMILSAVGAYALSHIVTRLSDRVAQKARATISP